jgi:trigger factor
LNCGEKPALLKGKLVNVTVEHLAPCRKLLRIEVDPQAVDLEFEKVTKQVLKHASLPGFRAGKAPRAMVEKVYLEHIDTEVRKQIIGQAYQEALKEHKLRPVGQPDVEEIQFGRGIACQFAVTIDTAPEFELPEYRGLPVRIVSSTVTDQDMEKAMEVLRQQRGSYTDMDRAAVQGDFLVVNYNGFCEGKPIAEIAPAAQGLSERKNFWIHLAEEGFLPGFIEQLVGVKAGEKRKVNVKFDAGFAETALANKDGEFEVEVLKVKEHQLPEINVEFAKSYGAADVEALRVGVRHDLEVELKNKVSNEIANQIVKALLERITCDLPESAVTAETRNVVYDVVKRNKERGITKEAIDEKKEEIYSFANSNAKDRVKTHFILNRIAENEKIRPSREEIAQRITQMAAHYQIPLPKLVRQLEENKGISEIAERIMIEKVIDFLKLHAKIEEVAAEIAAPAGNA